MTDFLRISFVVILCMCLLVSCSKPNEVSSSIPAITSSQSSSVPASQISEPEPEPHSPVGSLDPTPLIESATGNYWICIYQPQGTYEINKITDGLQYSVLDLIRLCSAPFAIDPLLIGFDIQKGMITLDWESSFVDSLIDAEQENFFLASVCMTIKQNLQQSEWFNLKKDGREYISPNITLELDQAYEYPPLRIGDGTPEYYTAIREAVPYPGMLSLESESLFEDMSEEMRPIIELLMRAGVPAIDAEAPADLPDEFVVGSALNNLPMYSTYYSDYDYIEELIPIGAAVNDTTFTLKEHVEAAIYEMFGNIDFNHISVDGWIYHETEGVYTPPHRGGGALQVPYIFTSIEGQNSIVIEASYLYYGMNGFIHPETGYFIDPEQSELLVPQAARLVPRYDIILRKTAIGWQLYSHKLSKQITPDREEITAEINSN